MPTYDFAKRRRGVRRTRETGIWVYIPGVELEAQGFKPGDPAPWYQLWPAGRKMRLLVGFYREP